MRKILQHEAGGLEARIAGVARHLQQRRPAAAHAGDRDLFTAVFLLVMSKEAYASLAAAKALVAKYTDRAHNE